MGKSLVTGVDIGHHSIKAVVLKQSKGTYKLVSYREVSIESDIFTDNHMVNYQKIVKKLKELRKGLPLFSRKVALAVPDNAVISKVLQIDSDLDEQETEFAIMQAFSHQSPFPVETLNLDFVELDINDRQESKQGMRHYQVYATKKEVVESRTLAALKSGFKPLILDVQAHGLTQVWQLFSKTYQKQDWLLIDVGLTQSFVCMDFANKPPFNKDIAIGTQSLESAEGGADAGHLNTENFIAALIEKLQRNIQLVASLHGVQIKGVWLSGGGAQTPMLAEEIARRLNMECQRLNPLALFSSDNFKHPMTVSDESAFTTATGLAMLGLDWQERVHAS